LKTRVAEVTSKSAGNRCCELRLIVQVPGNSLGETVLPQPATLATIAAKSRSAVGRAFEEFHGMQRSV
jgi:hypothetical protein